MPDFVIATLTAHPWLVWVWLGASVLAIGFRAAWDVTEERPRVVRFVLAVIDCLQLNLSGPVKLASNAFKGKPQQ